jgi:uncharacterized protein
MDPIILKTIDFVKEKVKNYDAGHDWWHIERVWRNAQYINQFEHGDAFIIDLAALLHDIADAKFFNGDENVGPAIAKEYLNTNLIDFRVIEQVGRIIENMSFRKSLGLVDFQSQELDIVQDADRLDAIGAIGIARAFTYGGYKNRELYNPEIPPLSSISQEEYKKSTGPTINHFYEKLLLLKDKMKTRTGKRLAEERHYFMEKYLDQFYKEWNGLY